MTNQNECIRLADEHIRQTFNKLAKKHIYPVIETIEIYGGDILLSGNKLTDENMYELSDQFGTNVVYSYYEKIKLCNKSIQKLQKRISEDIEILKNEIINRIEIEIADIENVNAIIENGINEVFEENVITTAITKSCSYEKGFEYTFRNFAVTLKNMIFDKLNNATYIPVNIKVFTVVPYGIGYEICKNSDKEDIFFDKMFAMINDRVSKQTTQNKETLEKIYNNALHNYLQTRNYNQQMIKNNKKVCFASCTFSAPLNGANKNILILLDIIKELGYEGFVNSSSNISILKDSTHIENLLKKLCDMANLRYSYAVDHLYTNLIYNESNECSVVVDMDKISHGIFVQKIITAYIDTKYGINNNNNEVDINSEGNKLAIIDDCEENKLIIGNNIQVRELIKGMLDIF